MGGELCCFGGGGGSGDGDVGGDNGDDWHCQFGRWICAKRGSFMRSLVDITIFSGDGIDNDDDDDDFAAGDEHCFVMIVFYSQLARAFDQV